MNAIRNALPINGQTVGEQPTAVERLALEAILLLAIGLRLFRLGAQSLWVDELFTLQNLTVPLSGVPEVALRLNNAPPLYFFLAWPFRALMGDAEWCLRLPSAIAGTVGVLLLHRVARRWTGCERTALYAALLLAINPLHLWYSQEARNYTLTVSLMLGASLAFERAVERHRTWDWGLLGGMVVASAATATQGLLVLPLMAVRMVFAPPPRSRWRAIAVCLGSSGTVALCIAVAVALANSRPPPPRPFTGAELAYSAYCFTVGYSFGPSLHDLQTLPLRQAIGRSPVQLALGFLLVGATLLAWLRVGWRKAGQAAAWIVAGVGFGLAIHFGTPHTYHVRYVLPALVGWLLLTSLAVSGPGWPRAALLSAHLLLAAWSCAQWFFVPAYGKDDTRAAVARLQRDAPDIRRVLVAPPYMRDPVDHYAVRLGLTATVEGMDSADDFDAGERHSAILLTRSQHVVFRASLDATLRQAVEAQGWSVATSRTYRIYRSPTKP